MYNAFPCSLVSPIFEFPAFPPLVLGDHVTPPLCSEIPSSLSRYVLGQIFEALLRCASLEAIGPGRRRTYVCLICQDAKDGGHNHGVDDGQAGGTRVKAEVLVTVRGHVWSYMLARFRMLPLRRQCFVSVQVGVGINWFEERVGTYSPAFGWPGPSTSLRGAIVSSFVCNPIGGAWAIRRTVVLEASHLDEL